MRKISLVVAQVLLACLMLMANKASASVTPGFSVSRSIICSGDTVVFTNTTTASSGARLSYYWNFSYGSPYSCNTRNPAVPIQFYGYGAPTIQLQVFDTTTGSYYYFSSSITVRNLPNAWMTSSPGSLHCMGDSVLLSASVSAGTAMSVWTKPGGIHDTVSTEIARTGGTYTLVAIDTNGCVSNPYSIYVDSSTRFGVQINLAGSYDSVVTACEPSYGGVSMCANTIGSGSYPFNFSWSTGTSGTYANCTSISSSGYYIVTATDGHGCVARDTLHAIIIPLPSSTITTFPMVYCEGDTVRLTADTTASSYNWNTGDTTRSIRVTSNGYYNVHLMNGGGCSQYTGINVNYGSRPTIYFSDWSAVRNSAGILMDTSWTCNNMSNTLSSSMSYTSGWYSPIASYHWNTGDTISSTPVTGSGIYKLTVITSAGCVSSDSQYVVVSAAPDTSIIPSMTGTLCSGDRLTLGVTSGYAGYSWSTGSTSDSVVVTTTGVYSCSMINSAGCSANTRSYVATFNTTPSPSVSVGPCIGAVGVYDTTAHYQWFDISHTAIGGATSYLYTPSASGFFQVRQTSSMGCVGTANFEWITCGAATGGGSSDTSVLSASFVRSSGMLCHPGSVNFINTTSGDTSTQSYLWTFDGGTPASDTTRNASSHFSLAGIHNVVLRVTSGSNVSYYTSTVTIDSMHISAYASSSAVSATSGMSINLCTSDHPTVGVYSTYGTGVSYVWTTTGSTLSSFTPSISGHYVVTATDANGCTASDSVGVVLNASPDTTMTLSGTLCIGTTATLSVPSGAGTYSWSTGSTTHTATVSATGTYSLTATSSGCTSHGFYHVVFNLLPTVLIYVTPSVYSYGGSIDTSRSCRNASPIISVYPSSGETVSWNTGSTASSFALTTPGLEIATITNTATGCFAKDSIFTILNNAPDSSISVTGGTCVGDTQVIHAISGSSYLWNTGTTHDSILVFASGTYSVTITNTSGCVSHGHSVVNFNALPTPSITAYTCNLTLVSVDAGATYQWLMAGVPISGATSTAYTATSSAYYRVSEINADGCASTSNTLFDSACSTTTIDTCAIHPQALPAIVTGGTCMIGSSVMADSFCWYFNGVAMASSNTQYVTVASPGFYTVQVWNTYKCSQTSTSMYASCTTGIVELDKADVSIYPNPFVDNLVVKGNGGMNVFVFNTLGQQVLNVHGENTMDVPTSSLVPGLYTVVIKNSENIEIKRIKVVKN